MTLPRLVAVTGATGFVGQAVMDEAAKQGLAIRALTRRDQREREGVTWICGDLEDEAGLAKLVEGVDAVLHIAGVVNAPTHALFHAGNVAGTERVVAAARLANGGNGVQRFVHVSSMAAREPGLSEYCRTKRLGEEIVQTSGLDWAAVRPPAVYGPRDTELFELFKAAKLGLIPVPRGGRTSLIHVADLARLLLALLPKGAPSGVIYEADDGREGGWAHTDLARAIGTAVNGAAGGKTRVFEISPRLVHLGARIDRLVRGRKAKLTPDRANYMCHPDWVCDPDAAPPADLWRPQIAAAEGLAETAAWYRAQGWL